MLKCRIAATACGKHTLQELERAIAIREQTLKETAAESTIATAINILASLKGRTKVAKLMRSSKKLRIEKTGYTASYYTVGSRRVRCARASVRGARIEARVRCAKNVGTSNAGLSVFRVSAEDLKGGEYLIIARNLKDAESYEVSRRNARIARYRGLARAAIAAIQSKVATKGGAIGAGNGYLAAVVAQEAHVEIDESGYSSGHARVTVRDNLKYAELALKGGAADLELAMQKAANRTIGIVNNYARKYIDPARPKLPSPFPEVRAAR